MHDYEQYIRFLLSEGYEIDVDCEEEELLSRSKDFDAIKSAMQEVDECHVIAFEPENKARRFPKGSVSWGYMVLSNHPSEWLSDYPVNSVTRKFEHKFILN
tara:strand:+ start:356 stop:658 length:303 start_codon:yes stop_codon:yes gene_type:complete